MKYVLLQAPAVAERDVFDLAEGERNVPEIRIFSEELPVYRRQIRILEQDGWKRVGILDANLTPRDLRRGLVTDTRTAGAAGSGGDVERAGICDPVMQLMPVQAAEGAAGQEDREQEEAGIPVTAGELTAEPVRPESKREVQEPPMGRTATRKRAGTYRKGKSWRTSASWTTAAPGKKIVKFPAAQ